MIPAIIHGNWFGPNQPSQLLRQIRESVVRLHPRWTFVDVDGGNAATVFDQLHGSDPDFSAQSRHYYDRLLAGAERFGVYVWTSDFFRLLQLYTFGGFWLDWDMYCLQPLDRFRDDDIVLGSINPALPSEAIIGTEAADPRIRDLMLWMMERQPPERGACSFNLGGYVIQHGLPTYPAEYFIPHGRDEGSDESLYRHTDYTHFIHCWSCHSYDLRRLEQIGESLRSKKG